MREADLDHLTRLLRIEMTAVHQQFFHMLALRQWKNDELLGRITAVDTEDFQNAMQIIDLLVSRRLPVVLDSHGVVPGSDVASIVRSELRMEENFADLLAEIRVADPEAEAHVDRASAPRREYREWLSSRSGDTDGEHANCETGKALAAFLGRPLALVEQPMLHAFLLWHLGDRAGADNAWRLSGAAMLYGTAIFRRGAAENRIPTPATSPGVRMAASPPEALAGDLALVKQCADLGRDAAQAEGETAAGRLCTRIAEDCDLIAGMKPDEDFPAVFGRSPVFESFAATRSRHLN